MPPITLWFLQASRCIRTAWLLEELGLDYEVKFSPRENGIAPAAFKKEAGGLGKFPTLQDGDVTLYESGNIAEYLCDTYDKQHRLLPPLGDPKRYEVLQWVHAAEATWALHGIAILYVRWHQKDGDVKKTEEGLSKNVINDMNLLESTLEKSSGKFLLGDKVTVADTLMHFSAVFILARDLGVKGEDYPRCKKFIQDCEATESYKKAVERTGHSLG
ncbi:uncharacterized protein LTR77_007790 [Saxophila tyrrhenica]|uniref:Glutathione S-transferase n=1 Tax=Saxophila tyrrhenica TaxID=1690608 RepID=A0AAV9P6W6_9PEZI|nr:hypothetical protein LTR77_007790 [Saxophila tyrrhenica]